MAMRSWIRHQSGEVWRGATLVREVVLTFPKVASFHGVLISSIACCPRPPLSTLTMRQTVRAVAKVWAMEVHR